MTPKKSLSEVRYLELDLGPEEEAILNELLDKNALERLKRLQARSDEEIRQMEESRCEEELEDSIEDDSEKRSPKPASQRSH